MIVLHEEGEGGSAISDLSGPVIAVSAAVNNLVLVSYLFKVNSGNIEHCVKSVQS